MDTITKDTVVFDQVYSDQAVGSLYRNVELGVNLPREVSIRHQTYVDSKTKKPGRRSVVRFDRNVALADGTIAPVTCSIVMMIPNDANVTTGIVQEARGIAFNMHQHTDFTDLGDVVFVNAGQ